MLQRKIRPDWVAANVRNSRGCPGGGPAGHRM